jgi:predicted nucleotidyltransferase
VTLVKEENIVREFRRCIEHRFPEQSPQVVLYGSYAWGDSHVDSDIEGSIDYRLSIVVVSRDHYERLKRGGSAASI